jgi:16S rRNA (cytosine1402-N4)-methyltransferase
MPAAISALALGGRIVVMAYHSLEDRISKQALVAAANSSAPLELPIELPEHAPTLKLLVKGAESAGVEEISRNPRAASVRLRAAEKIRRAA